MQSTSDKTAYIWVTPTILLTPYRKRQKLRERKVLLLSQKYKSFPDEAIAFVSTFNTDKARSAIVFPTFEYNPDTEWAVKLISGLTFVVYTVYNYTVCKFLALQLSAYNYTNSIFQI